MSHNYRAQSRKSLVWVALFLYTGYAAQLAAGSDQCELACNSIKSEISSSQACAKAKKTLPRPKIGRLCKEAFNEAFELTCVEACRLYGTDRTPTSRLGEVCDKRKRIVPRPVAYKACEDGFNAGFTATKALITKTLLSMNEISRRVLAENHAGPLKDKDTQRERLENADRAEAAIGFRQERIQAIEEEVSQVPHALPDGVTQTVRAAQTIELPKDPRTHEVLTTDHLKGFKNPTKERGSGFPKNKELTAIARATEGNGVGADVDLEQFVEPLRTGRYREVVAKDNVEGSEIPASKEAGNIQGNELERSNEKEGDASAQAFATIELPNSPQFREVLRVEHVQGFRNRAKEGSSGIQVDKEPYAAAGAADKNGGAADVDVEKSIELPSTDRYQEEVMAEHVKGFAARAKEDVGEIQGSRFREAEAAGKEKIVSMELPDSYGHREVHVPERIEVHGTPAKHEQNGADDGQQTVQKMPVTAVAGSSDEDPVQEARVTSDKASATITLPKRPPFVEVFKAEHIKGFKPRVKEEATA